MPTPIRIAIAGTGTGVGKTTVAAGILAALRDAGRARLGLKPVESGYVADTSDASQLATAAGQALITPLYALAEPLSPHLAAERAGEKIDVNALQRWVEAAEATTQAAHPEAAIVSVVELAGGLFTPLTLELMNLDLVSLLEPCRFVLVAADRLGAFHDVLASVWAAAALHRTPDAVVLNPISPDHATPYNSNELRRLLPAVAIHPYDREPPEALLRRLGL
jgi:dethiobiotin synthetase